MTMSIELNFFLQWNEYYAALEFFRRQRGSIPSDKVVGGLLMLLGVMIWLATGNGLLAVAFLAGGVAVALLSAPFRRMLFKQRWLREPLYSAEYKIAFGEQGVFFQMGAVESNLPWSYYESFLEVPEGFLLIYGEAFNFFPKRGFASETAIQEFRELIRKKLKA
jgi:hypothetical protein